jgi:CubicO group peptidase (beta-lactamase class C family)
VRLATLIALALVSATARGAPDAGVDRVLAARIDGDRSGVCVVAVVVVRQRDGAVDEQRADRCATGARSLPTAPGYRFEIGSISKAFTGVLLSEMAERKELSLDDTVQQHLPAGVTMPRFEGLEVTLRDLVTHTSGLPALPPGMRPLSQLNPYVDVDEKVIVGGLSHLALTHPPGEQHAYSNWAFMLLSDIVGRRAGQPYDALLTERVLAPLGMKDTIVSDDHRLIPGHTSFGRPTPAWDFPPRFGGVGAIRSTPEDMARFARAMLGDMPKDAPDTLKRALVTSTQPQRVVRESLTMATAWFVLKRPESVAPWIFHNGMTGGFSSTLLVDPQQRRAALVLADAFGGFDDIAFHLLAPGAALREPARPVALDLERARAAVGRYRLRENFELALLLDGEALYGQATGQGRFPLKQDSRGDYYTEVTELLLRVVRDRAGKGTELVLLQGGGMLRGKRVE